MTVHGSELCVEDTKEMPDRPLSSEELKHN